eukprot:CAMPEP_0197435754 /NCGR_PEP_ID=MMETSP1175-20131217/3290_1 /TAXON_ID=1003142 /ORGANISM="Triceratium dubium, Strain CCMP147" /LENGTH=44 /DNA_ID= /DNA_START= /DNA_END= /DNA_ORIENTATION=
MRRKMGGGPGQILAEVGVMSYIQCVVALHERRSRTQLYYWMERG